MTGRRRPGSRRVRAHHFDPDPRVPTDWRGRRFCQRCHLPGHDGDDRHPEPRYPTTPTEVLAAERRRLGEPDDERT
jgi:hypothetical protein